MRLLRAGVEESRCGVREPLLRHQVVSLEGRFKIVLVDANRAPHQHVLRSLSDFAINSQQVRLLERLEAEEIIVEVAREIKLGIDALIVLLHDLIHSVGKKRRRPANLVDKSEQLLAHLFDARIGPIVQGLDGHAVSQLGIIRMHDRHIGTCLSSQIRDFLGRHAYRGQDG